MFPRRHRPRLDLLEDRLAPAVFAVTNTLDSGPGSLRQAIVDANTTAGADAIVFNLPTSDPNFVGGTFVIRPTSLLPELNDPTGGTTLDGHSQTAFTGDTNPSGPEIVLDGVHLGAGGAFGLSLPGNDNRILGVNVQRFAGHGVQLRGHRNVVAGNYIGTNAAGTAAAANGGHGVYLFGGAQLNRIGTDGDGVGDALERNVISGNGNDGIAVNDVGTDRNVIAGNYVGTNAAGTAALRNATSGVAIFLSAKNNRVGTDGSADAFNVNERNLISGNGTWGVFLAHASTSGNVVAGNYLGTNAAGTAALANGSDGVILIDAPSNTIGTNSDGNGDAVEGNLISGNAFNGVVIQGVNGAFNVVAGNVIGLNAAGTAALGNGDFGVLLQSKAHDNRIGVRGDHVADVAERNVISGNRWGVVLRNAETSNNQVSGNYIGLNPAGTAAIRNRFSGVVLHNGASDNTIGTRPDGTADAAERNVIAGHQDWGVALAEPGTQRNVVAGNYIGTDPTGTVAIGNGINGVIVYGGAQNNVIGIPGGNIESVLYPNAFRNLISGNGQDGVNIQGAGTDANRVAGNYIGTRADGLTALPNGLMGVAVVGGAKFNRIGTNGDGSADAGERNVISGNANNGVAIFGTGTDGNSVAGNYLGTNPTGTAALPNGGNGVSVYGGAKNNRVGTNGDGVGDAAERNVISGNSRNGVELFGAGTEGNVVAGNYLGTNAAGTAALANGWNGLAIYGGARFNRIGTDGNGVADTAERNVISGNTFGGVLIWDVGTEYNWVAGNHIGTNALGTAAVANGGLGIDINLGAASNRIGTDGNGVNDDAERNVISGNGSHGIQIGAGGSTPSTDANVVAGNYIGTNAAGTAAVRNGAAGVLLIGNARANRIGTNADGVADTAEGNVISGNATSGVEVTITSSTTVAGNFIGTNAGGSAALGNGGVGVRLNRSAGGVIGGSVPAAGNTIAFNGAAGVSVSDFRSAGNQIRLNRIFSNGGLGIDLGNDGVTANDLLDADAGPNGLQNFPVLTHVQGGATTRVLGTLHGAANTAFTVDFYGTDAADPSGHGEGQRYLGSASVTTDAAGAAVLDVTLPVPLVGWVTATATDPTGNTSEFSPAVTRLPNQAPVLDPIADRQVDEASTLTFSVTATDPDGDNLTFGLLNAPPGAAIDPVSGVFTWTPTDGTANTVYTVTVVVTDDGTPLRSAMQNVVITVHNIPPTASLTNNGPRSAGDPVTVTFSGQSDPSPEDTAAGFVYSFDFNNDGDFNDPGDQRDVPSPTATFPFATAGTYPVRGRIADKDGGFTESTTLVTVVAPPRVESVQVNDGHAQRSKVQSLTVTFDRVVRFERPLDDVFIVTHTSGRAVGLLFAVSTVAIGGVDRTRVGVTFAAAALERGSLADGRYILAVRADLVRDPVTGGALDGNDDGRTGGHYGFHFHRLFGDGDGDADVDNDDLALFRAALPSRSNQAKYRWYYDADADADIDAADFLQFQKRFRTRLG